MKEENKSFSEKLDRLIKLFKKIKKRAENKNLEGIDRSFFSNFEMIVNNYESIKDTLSDDILNQIGEPFKQIIEEMIEKMEHEITQAENTGQKNGDFTLDTEKDDIFTPPGYDGENKKNKSTEQEIKEIDNELKNGSLSIEQINDLLDRRSYLLQS
mgnify:CR=1 FL=1